MWSSYTTEVSRENDFKIHSEFMKCTVIVMYGWQVELVQKSVVAEKKEILLRLAATTFSLISEYYWGIS